MKNYHLFVWSNPVDDQHEEFNRWYDEVHLADMVKVPGVKSAQRFRLNTETDGPALSVAHYAYLTVYVVRTSSMEETMALISERIETGEIRPSKAFSLSESHIVAYEVISSPVKSY